MDKLIDRFLTWPLPDSVCPDACTINKRAHGTPRPTGTNLLSAIEARQMLEHVLTDTIQIPIAEYEKLKADAERYRWLRDESLGFNMVGSFDPYVVIGQSMSPIDGTKLDAAIDAAIKQEASK